MRNFDANTTTKALTIKKENSLSIIHNITYTAVRISKKAIFAAIVLSVVSSMIFKPKD